jgi:hypothetical protein
MFVVCTFAAVCLYYRTVAAKETLLENLRRQAQKEHASPPEMRLARSVQELQEELVMRGDVLSVDNNGSNFLGHLTRIMHDLDIQAPVIRSAEAPTNAGIGQTTIDVEFRGSLDATRDLWRRLSEASQSWCLSRISIERVSSHVGTLSVSARLVTFSQAPGSSAP